MKSVGQEGRKVKPIPPTTASHFTDRKTSRTDLTCLKPAEDFFFSPFQLNSFFLSVLLSFFIPFSFNPLLFYSFFLPFIYFIILIFVKILLILPPIIFVLPSFLPSITFIRPSSLLPFSFFLIILYSFSFSYR